MPKKPLIPGPHKGYTPDTRQRLQRATRFFARLDSFTMECPRCGKVYQIRVDQKSSGWDPTTGRWRCSKVKSCNRTYILGIVAWPVYQHVGDPATPEDQVPSPRQLAELRREGGGWWLADESTITEARPVVTNLTLEEQRPQHTDEEEGDES